VLELLILLALPLLVVAALVWAMSREDSALRRRARRFRELEHEGIEELRRGTDDPYPEQSRVEGGFLREPNGRRADAERVLREELEHVREHTRRASRRRSRGRSLRRGRGAECLL
jgi:hypothetical protein